MSYQYNPNIVCGEIYPTVMLKTGGTKTLKRFHKVCCMMKTSDGGRCQETLLLSPGARGKLSPDGVAIFAKQKGWYADKKGYALCMSHAPGSPSRPKSTMAPSRKRAAFNRIKLENLASAMKDKEARVVPSPIMTILEDQPMTTTAEPPRVATREDKRRIRDFLDLNYDQDQGRYAKDWDDDKSAKKLGVPRAWVSDLREDLYGPNVSEAGLARNQEMMELLAIASKLKDDALSIATRAEELEKSCRRALG